MRNLLIAAALLVGGCDPDSVVNSPPRDIYNVTPLCDLSILRVGGDVTEVRRACGLPSFITSWDSDPDRYQWVFGNIATDQHDQVYVNGRGFIVSLQPISSPDRSHQWYPPL
jgi:hypothetical protein